MAPAARGWRTSRANAAWRSRRCHVSSAARSGVNALTREPLLAASRIGYRPPRETAARTLAVVVSDIANPFYGAIIKGSAGRGSRVLRGVGGYQRVGTGRGEAATAADPLLHRVPAPDPTVVRHRHRARGGLLPVRDAHRWMRGVSSIVANTASGMRALPVNDRDDVGIDTPRRHVLRRPRQRCGARIGTSCRARRERRPQRTSRGAGSQRRPPLGLGL